jgi:hypothetical protein
MCGLSFSKVDGMHWKIIAFEAKKKEAIFALNLVGSIGHTFN